MFTQPFNTIEEAIAEGKRIWLTPKFNVIELTGDNLEAMCGGDPGLDGRRQGVPRTHSDRPC